MSAVETRQMSSDETGQVSSVPRTDIYPVSTHNVDVSEVSIVQVLQNRVGEASLHTGQLQSLAASGHGSRTIADPEVPAA